MNDSLSEEERQEIRSYMLDNYGYAIETLNEAVCSMIVDNDNLALTYFLKHMRKIVLIVNQVMENGNAADPVIAQ